MVVASKKLIYIFLVLILILGGYFYESHKDSGEKIQGSLQGIVLEDIYGNPYDLGKLKGQNIYLKLWASWSPVCVAELPQVEDLAGEKDKNFQVITVVFPKQYGEQSMEQFRQWYELKAQPHTIVLFDRDGKLAKLVGLNVFPTNVFVDDNLQLQRVITGSISNAEIKKVMDSFAHTKGNCNGDGVVVQQSKQSYQRGDLRIIYLAGGCFWGVQAYFDRVPGVVSTEVGYANGKWNKPSYEDLKLRNSGHAETVKVTYDVRKITLAKLLAYYFQAIDPTTLDQQGPDFGKQYRSGIYYVNPEDGEIAKEVLAKEQRKYKKKIVVEVLPLERYDAAEEYHQEYLQKNPYGTCTIDLNLAKKEPKD